MADDKVAAWRRHVTRHIAFTIYAEMPAASRGLHALRAEIRRRYGSAPRFETLAAWSVSDSWGERLTKIDVQTYDKIGEVIVAQKVDAAARRIAQVRDIHDQAVDLLLRRLKDTTGYYARLERQEVAKGEKPAIDLGTATGAKAFMEMAMLAQRHIDALEGKVQPDTGETDRSSDHGSLLGRFQPGVETTSRPN